MSEARRVAELGDDASGWRRWGPYVADRSWGTVREDYSANGEAWTHVSHDHARSKAFRWGEDAIAGFCDRYQHLVLAPAFWNERDPILKERLFGLTPLEGNHGEDAKELWYHLDAVPSHAYMRFLYKYPQREFPYAELVAENQRRAGRGREYELADTGIFDDGRYFDIFIEHAKASFDDVCVRIEAFNRGPEPAPLRILPHLWYRNTWSWRGRLPSARIRGHRHGLFAEEPELDRDVPRGVALGSYHLSAEPGGRALFTDNESNAERLYRSKSASPFVKDAFHRHLIHGEACLNPESHGTRAALDYRFVVPPGGSVTLRLRLAHEESSIDEVDRLVQQRRAEADDFFASIHPRGASAEEQQIQRQAVAGLLWTKQSYLFDVSDWLDGDDPGAPPPASRKSIRNVHWRHLNSLRVMTVPDKWEYPWFAAWDLAFHCVAYALVDAKYAKDQLQVLLFEQFQHPNGQLPAYEWEFSDLNPPVHAWAVWRVYNMDRIRNGRADRPFLERCFHKLLMNFASWVNKVDREGNNVFEGGFLGLDNITLVDRSEKLPHGATLEQSDATGWMGMFCLNLMRIALELARENPVYEGLATKFFQHYALVASAMKAMGSEHESLWDDEDGFFYDILRFPDGSHRKFRVRSQVGLIPLFAVERLERDWIEPFADFRKNLDWLLLHRSALVEDVVHTVTRGGKTTHVLTILDQPQLRRILQRVFDPHEFLAPHGLRSLSKAHERHPFELDGRTVAYEPGEAVSKIKGGNSNWRGPIWFPTSFLLIESLRKLGTAFGNDFVIDLPGGRSTFPAMARDLADRLISLFHAGPNGRPIHGADARYRDDPHFRELLLFHEYFHGDTGEGLGASHQTGWTALVASLIDEWRQ